MTEGKIQSEVSIRRFFLRRDEDETGTSGTGVVAEGVELSSGRVVLQFRSHMGTVTILDSMKVVRSIHGHDGRTKVVWIDIDQDEDETHTEEQDQNTEKNDLSN